MLFVPTTCLRCPIVTSATEPPVVERARRVGKVPPCGDLGWGKEQSSVGTKQRRRKAETQRDWTHHGFNAKCLGRCLSWIADLPPLFKARRSVRGNRLKLGQQAPPVQGLDGQDRSRKTPLAPAICVRGGSGAFLYVSLCAMAMPTFTPVNRKPYFAPKNISSSTKNCWVITVYVASDCVFSDPRCCGFLLDASLVRMATDARQKLLLVRIGHPSDRSATRAVFRTLVTQ